MLEFYNDPYAGWLVIVGILLLFFPVIYFVKCLSYAELIKKAGGKYITGFIPIYNLYVLYDKIHVNKIIIIFDILFPMIIVKSIPFSFPLYLIKIVLYFIIIKKIIHYYNKEYYWYPILICFPKLGLLVLSYSKDTVYNVNEKNNNSNIINNNSTDTSNNSNYNMNSDISFCPYCGNKVTEYDRFCPHCNNEL